MSGPLYPITGGTPPPVNRDHASMVGTYTAPVKSPVVVPAALHPQAATPSSGSVDLGQIAHNAEQSLGAGIASVNSSIFDGVSGALNNLANGVYLVTAQPDATAAWAGNQASYVGRLIGGLVNVGGDVVGSTIAATGTGVGTGAGKVVLGTAVGGNQAVQAAAPYVIASGPQVGQAVGTAAYATGTALGTAAVASQTGIAGGISNAAVGVGTAGGYILNSVGQPIGYAFGALAQGAGQGVGAAANAAGPGVGAGAGSAVSGITSGVTGAIGSAAGSLGMSPTGLLLGGGMVLLLFLLL